MSGARRPLVIIAGQRQTIPSTDTIQAPTPSSANASINLPHGTGPTSPADGDFWTTTAGLYMRINGRTIAPEKTVELLVSDPQGSAITTGDGKVYFRIPAVLDGMNLVDVAAAVATVSTSGLPTIQLARLRGGVADDMLSTKLTIDANEVDSTTAATAAVIDTSKDDVATADQIRVDIDVAGTGAKGLMVSMTFRRP